MTSRERNLHRNNVAEWVMWFALLPVWLVVLLMQRFRIQKD